MILSERTIYICFIITYTMTTEKLFIYCVFERDNKMVLYFYSMRFLSHIGLPKLVVALIRPDVSILFYFYRTLCLSKRKKNWSELEPDRSAPESDMGQFFVTRPELEDNFQQIKANFLQRLSVFR